MAGFFEKYNRLISEVHCSTGKGWFLEAAAAQDSLVHLMDEYYGPQHEQTINAMLVLGYYQRRCGRFAAAQYWYEQTLKYAVDFLGESHEITCRAWNNLATLMFRTGRYDDALKYYHQAIGPSFRRSGLTPDGIAYVPSMASAWRGKGDFEAALALYRIVPWLSDSEPYILSEDAMINSCFRLGQMLMSAGVVNDETERWFIRACEILSRPHNRYDPLADEAIAVEAECAACRGDFRRISVLKDRLADLSDRLGHEHPEAGFIQMMIGKLLVMAKRTEEAETALDAAQHTLCSTLGNRHIFFWMAKISKARLFLIKGDSKAARKILCECIDGMQSHFGASHPWLAEPIGAIADIESAEGNSERSQYMKQKADELKKLPSDTPDFYRKACGCLEKGQHLEAAILAVAAERQGVAAQDGTAQALAIECKGMACARLRWSQEAEAAFEEAAVLWLNRGDRANLARSLSIQADSLALLCRHDTQRIISLRQQAARLSNSSASPI